MRTYEGKTFGDVYSALLKDLTSNPEFVCAPRDQKINEIINAALVFDPRFPLYENKRRSSQIEYISAEFVWYFAGRNDLEFIEKYAKFWKDIANPDGTVNSAYGYLLFNRKNEHGLTQWQWAHDCLVKDKDSRQALIHFNTPDHQRPNTKDFVCTLEGLFHIRNNKLNFTILMRSNDVVLGLPTDVAFFCVLQQQMYRLLKQTYPDLELGTYTHISNSMHLYERNFKLVDDMLKEEFESTMLEMSIRDFVDSKGEMTTAMKILHDNVNRNDYFYYPVTDIFDWIVGNLAKLEEKQNIKTTT